MVTKEVKLRVGRLEVKFLDLHADDLIQCGGSEDNIRIMIECFAEVCKRRNSKVNVDKIKEVTQGGRRDRDLESI